MAIEKLFYVYSKEENKKDFFDKNIYKFGVSRNNYEDFYKNADSSYYFLIYNASGRVKLSQFEKLELVGNDYIVHLNPMVEYKETNISSDDLSKCKYFEKGNIIFEKSNFTYPQIILEPFMKLNNFNFLNNNQFSFKKSKRNIYIVKNTHLTEMMKIFKEYDIVYVVDTKLNFTNFYIYVNGNLETYPFLDRRRNNIEKNIQNLKVYRMDKKIKDDLYKLAKEKVKNPKHPTASAYAKEIEKIINELKDNGFYKESNNPQKHIYDMLISDEINYHINSLDDKENVLKNIDTIIDNVKHIYEKKTNEQKKEKKVEEIKQEIKKDCELNNYLAQNTIFYGAPGCGKSRFIKDLLNSSQEEKPMDNAFFKRVLFYPDYTYADFVGQVLPVFNEDSGRIEYKFQPGPFVEILKDAIANEKDKKQYFLIIEEINRGNAPAIFGDIFQLLDRNYDGNQKGKSEFEINNKEIQKIIGQNSVYIPSNLTILATMNTCDQNVFVLDTAFKRRWRMERISNKFKEEDKFKSVSVKKDEKDFFKWADFREKVNETIMNLDEDMGLDDKLLGTHFVNSKDISDIKIFAEKVFMYLWNDVVRYNKKVLFGDYKTLDNLIEKFVEGENVFAEGTPIREFYNNVLEKKLKKKA